MLLIKKQQQQKLTLTLEKCFQKKLSLSGRGPPEALQVKCSGFSLKYASEEENKKIKGGLLKLDVGYVALPLYMIENFQSSSKGRRKKI